MSNKYRQYDYLFHQGSRLLMQNDLAGAARALLAARAINPKHPDLHNNFGILLKRENKITEAIASYQKAIQLKPNYPEAHQNLGNAYRDLGQLDLALSHLRQAVHLKPQDANIHYALGCVLMDVQDWPNAQQTLHKTLQLKPSHFEAINALGAIEKQLGHIDAAMELFRRVMAIQPSFPDAYNNLAVLLREQGNITEAIPLYQQALQLNPNYIDALNNLGVAYTELKNIHAAKQCYEQALQLNPQHANSHFHLGTTLLMLGDLTQAWPHYEYRTKRNDQEARDVFSHLLHQIPRWQGESLPTDHSLLVSVEQGFGDTLQFARYLPIAKTMFARLGVIISDPLRTLFQNSFAPEITIIPPGTQIRLSDWQWYTPLLSLPLCFKTALSTIPAPVRYLHTPPQDRLVWQERLHPLAQDRKKIGLVWQSGKTSRIATDKSIPNDLILSLLDLSDYVWVSLQKEAPSNLHPNLIDWMAEMTNFADTAALIESLDLIISVDTAVAHLAAALGKPTWLLNRFASDWRWLLDRPDCPWYPSMRIFTQAHPHAWQPLMAKIIHSLKTFPI